MKKQINFVGLFDFKSGNDFGLPVLVVEPYVEVRDGNNIGEVEHIIEDYMINLSMNELPKSETLDMLVVQSDFEKAKKGSRRFKKWTALVEYDDLDPIEYNILKKTGF